MFAKLLPGLVLSMRLLFGASAPAINCPVWLDIQADDESLRNGLISSISKSIRDLGDVSLSRDPEHACFTLEVVAMPVDKRLPNSVVDRFAAAAFFGVRMDIDRVRRFIFKEMDMPNFPQERMNAAADALTPILNADAIIQGKKGLVLLTGRMANIDSVCKSIVADFDTGVIAEERRILQTLSGGKKH